MLTIEQMESLTIKIIKCLAKEDRDGVQVSIQKLTNDWSVRVTFFTKDKNNRTVNLYQWQDVKDAVKGFRFIKMLIRDEELATLFIEE